MSDPVSRPNRGMMVRVAALGVVALLLVWRTGCSDGNRRVASGEAGTSSGISDDFQQLAANRAAEVPGAPLTDLPATFTDQDGRTRHLAELRGRPWVASAIYTRCVSVCPRIVEELHALEKERAWAADTSWRGVLFSLDPAFDRPPVLREFVAARGIDTARWTVLVPDSASLEPLARALGLLARDDPGGGIAHTAVFAMVGADGRIADRRVGLTLPSGGLAAAWKRRPAH